MAEPLHEDYKTQLEGVKAPLGVILQLIRRDNLDIYDIPIARITEEYLGYLDRMEEMQIELAGEFFVMAATLMRIKIQMLLRRDDDEEDDPREGLVRSLLEYKKMVEAARTLGELEEERSKVFRRPIPDAEKQFTEEPTIELNLYQLMRAFQEVMVAYETVDVREIELETFTIEEKIEQIEEGLRANNQVSFHDLFAQGASRMELIVTFMALLELLKHAHIKVQQDAAFGTIWLYQGENFGQDFGQAHEWDADVDAPAEHAQDSPDSDQPVQEQDEQPESR